MGERQAEYWSRQLAGAVHDGAARRPAAAAQTHLGRRDDHRVALPPRLAQALTAAHEGPLLTVLNTALNAVLSRWAESTDITVGTVFAGRVRPELEPLIGFFPNTLVLRTSTAGDPSLSTLLDRTAEVVTDAHRHQELPSRPGRGPAAAHAVRRPQPAVPGRAGDQRVPRRGVHARRPARGVVRRVARHVALRPHAERRPHLHARAGADRRVSRPNCSTGPASSVCWPICGPCWRPWSRRPAPR